MPVFLSYILLIGSALLLAGVGVIISFLGEKACLSTQCVGQAKFIHRSMNDDLHPCDDFYSFVCNKFPQFGSTIVDEIARNQIKQVVDYLKEPSDWEEDDRLEHIAKNLYHSCNNDTKLELDGLRPLQRVISRLGGIPFLDSLWNSEMKIEFNVVDNDMKHFFNGLNSVFVYNRIIKRKTYPSLHPKNLSQEEKKKNSIHTFSVPPHLYTAVAPDPENYLKYCQEFNELYSTILSTNKNITDLDKREIKDAANFKIKFLQLIDKTRNCSEQPFKFVEVPYKKKFGKINPEKEESYKMSLQEYIVRKAEPGTFSVDYAAVTPKFEHYIDQLDKLLESTPDRVLANYMGIEALIQVTPFLPLEFRDIYDKYLKPEKDKHNKMIKERKMHCAKLVKDAMATALTAQYLIDKPQLPNELSNFNILSREILRHVKEILKNIKWASREDYVKMFRLAKKIKIVSPLPPDVWEKMTNKTAFDSFYLIMCENEDSTLESYLSVKAVRMIRNAQILNAKSDSGNAFPYTVFHEDYDIFDTEIYFQQDSNMIVVPLGYLYYPSLDSLWPKYLSYGGLAVWIAHKIIQTVGYNNVLYPELKPGEEISRNWWNEKTITGYESKRECAFEEYNEYLEPFKIKSTDANCLDNTLYYAAAVEAAYFAYKEDTKMRFFVEPQIPYLTEYTVDQIFFIKYASSFCHYEGGNKSYVRDSDSSRVSTNFTILYSLRNFKTFSDVFACNHNEKMFKAEPCDMWSPTPTEK